MSDYDTLLETVEKMELTAEQKSSILAPAKLLNTELGVRGSDLINVKKELTSTKEQNLTYKSLSDTLAKHNVKQEDIKKIGEKIGLTRSQEDENNEFKKLLKESQDKEKSTSEELRVFKQEKAFAPAFDEAVKNFKDKDGKSIEILPGFADAVKTELFKGIKDGEDEILINDKINKALLQAHSDQTNFMVKNNLVQSNQPVHKVGEKNLGGSGPVSGNSSEDIKKVLVEGGGTIDAAARAVAMARSTIKK